MTTDEVRALFHANRRGQARCPNHDDHIASLTISPGREGRVLVHCHAGCDTSDVLKHVELTRADLQPDKTKPAPATNLKYPYHDENGRIVYHIVRGPDKQFRADRKVPETDRVPYHLPEICKAVTDGRPIFIVEGEKDADRLRSLGLTATCNPFGAGKWSKSWDQYFKDAHVVIIPDNDQAGRDHATDVRAKLVGATETIDIIDLAGQVPDKGDISDWLNAGHDIGELADLAADDQPPETSWWPLEIGPILAGDTLNDPPTMLARSDGHCLLYPGMVHALYGEPESGKSWLALAACAEQVRAGRTVLYLDFEDAPHRVISRLRSLRVPDELLAAHFRYSRPTEPYPDIAARMIDTFHPVLIILDAITEAMTVDGLNAFSGADRDYPEWHARVVRPFTAGGAAVLLLDHVVKAKDQQGRWAAGTQHKLSALDGAGYRLTTDEPFGFNRTGHGKLIIGKDRPGHVREHQIDGGIVADVTLNGVGDDRELVTVEIGEPTHRDERLSRSIMDFLRREEGKFASKNAIYDAVGNGIGKGTVTTAIDGLITAGHCDLHKSGNSHLVFLTEEV